MSTREQIESDLATAKATIARLEQQLKELPKEEPVWKPTEGDWCIGHHDCAWTAERVIDMTPESGHIYPTKEAAEAAKGYLAWYALLLNLAAQVNPSGKVGGPFWIEKENDQFTPYGFAASTKRDSSRIFETARAAEKACDILRRQNGVLGGVSCPF